MKIALIIILILLIIILIVSYIVYKIAFYNIDKNKDGTYAILTGEQYDKHKETFIKIIDEVINEKYEEVYIKSYDNKTLYGRYFHRKDGGEVQILFHGYKGNAYKDMSGGLKLALDYGSNVLIVDQRGHGKSDGKTISFGIKERKDVVSWINYINKRFNYNVPIVISGISMGAATVLMAANLNLPQNVIGIIADCPFSSPTKMLLIAAKQMKIPSFIAYPFLYIGALVYGHFNLNEATAIKSVKGSNLPILLIHGDDDRLVPCSMSEDIYNARPANTKLVLFKDAAHGISYVIDKEKYKQESKEFLDKIFNEYFKNNKELEKNKR